MKQRDDGDHEEDLQSNINKILLTNQELLAYHSFMINKDTLKGYRKHDRVVSQVSYFYDLTILFNPTNVHYPCIISHGCMCLDTPTSWTRYDIVIGV